MHHRHDHLRRQIQITVRNLPLNDAGILHQIDQLLKQTGRTVEGTVESGSTFFEVGLNQGRPLLAIGMDSP